jgi:hypothetical protein
LAWTLTDAEVERLFQRRLKTGETATAILQKAMENDPTSHLSEHVEHAHLFVIAEPLFGKPDLLQPWITGNDWRSRFNDILYAVEPVFNPRTGPYKPNFRDLSSSSRGRISGVGLHTFSVESGRRIVDGTRNSNLLDLEAHENGGLELFCGRASDDVPHEGVSERFLVDAVIAGLTLETLSLAGRIAETCGHRGRWAIGIGVSNTNNLSAFSQTKLNAWVDPTLYARYEYTEALEVWGDELIEKPKLTTQRLLGRFLRSLQVDQYYEEHLAVEPTVQT